MDNYNIDNFTIHAVEDNGDLRVSLQEGEREHLMWFRDVTLLR